MKTGVALVVLGIAWLASCDPSSIAPPQLPSVGWVVRQSEGGDVVEVPGGTRAALGYFTVSRPPSICSAVWIQPRSGEFEILRQLVFKGIEYDITTRIVDANEVIDYVSTDSSSFISPEGVRVGMPLAVVKKHAAVAVVEELEWGCFACLPSGWGLKVGSPSTPGPGESCEKKATEESVVESMFQRTDVCRGQTSNPRLDAPHSGVTALAQGRKRRTTGRVRQAQR